MGTGIFNAGSNPVMDWHPIQGGVKILLVVSRYRNWNKLCLKGHLVHTDFYYLYIYLTKYMYMYNVALHH